MAGGAWQAIVFDFDGVIADSMPKQERAWREAWQQEGAPALAAAALPILLENLWDGCAGFRIFERTAIPVEMQKRLRVAKDTIWKARRSETEAIPGVVEAVRRLSEGRRLAIATSAHREYVEVVLKRVGLLEEFALILTDADVARGKPAPDALLAIAARLGVATSELLMIGDTVTDSEMAKSAGSGIALLRTYDKYRAAPEGVAGYRSWAELVREISALAQRA